MTNDLSAGVCDITEKSGGVYRYMAMDATRHLVAHNATGMSWWVESTLLSDRIQDLVDKLDGWVLDSLITLQKLRIAAQNTAREPCE